MKKLGGDKIVVEVSKEGWNLMSLKEIKNEVYGRDRLTIDQMTDSKEKAIEAGHSHFFTGEICRNGHIAPRTRRGECNQCVRDTAKRTMERRKIKKKVDPTRSKSFKRQMSLFSR